MGQHMQAATVLYLRLSTKTGKYYENRGKFLQAIKQLFHCHSNVLQSPLNI